MSTGPRIQTRDVPPRTAFALEQALAFDGSVPDDA